MKFAARSRVFLVAAVRKDGGTAEKIKADRRAPGEPHLLAKRVRAIIGDRLDILVANAGISRAGTIEEITVETFDDWFAVNVRLPYFLVQQLLPALCPGSGVVVLSSLAARTSLGHLSAYAAMAIDFVVPDEHVALNAGLNKFQNIPARQHRKT